MNQKMRAAAPAVALAAVLLAGALPARAADPDAGRYLAATCAGCHGTDGRSTGSDGIPSLAGQSRSLLIEQMNAFRAGTRKTTVMQQIARGYTDAQIAQLADFFASRSK